MLAPGRFDTNRINSFASTGGAKLTTYNGVQVMSGGAEGGKSGWLAVLDNVTAVAARGLDPRFLHSFQSVRALPGPVGRRERAELAGKLLQMWGPNLASPLGLLGAGGRIELPPA